MPMTAAARAWLAQNTDIAPDRLRWQALPGATSSSVFRVWSTEGGEQFVLRVIDNPAWLAEEPDIAEHEAAVLAEAQRAGLPAPRPLAFADDAGFGAPVVLMSFLAGEVKLRLNEPGPWMAALAAQLVAIHAHPAASLRWSFQSWVDVEALAPPAWSEQPGLWSRAIDRWRAGPPPAPLVFVHRDYHAVNVLWRNGGAPQSNEVNGDEVSGVVDWASACRGPAGADVAHCRTDLALMAGPALAARFLAAYETANSAYRHDPYWDIDSILDICLPAPVYYPPWQLFGLGPVAAPELCQRIEAHLAAVLERL